jgi:hypothetical protein
MNVTLGSRPRLVPELEHDQRPQLATVVATALDVVAKERTNGVLPNHVGIEGVEHIACEPV